MKVVRLEKYRRLEIEHLFLQREFKQVQKLLKEAEKEKLTLKRQLLEIRSSPSDSARK